MRPLARRLLILTGTATLTSAFVWSAAVAVPSANAAPRSSPPPSTERVCSQQVPLRTATCFALRRTDSAIPHGTPSGLGPSNLRSAYKLANATGGGGRTVALIDAFDDPAAESDLAVYRSQFGLPACTTGNGCFRKVNENGVTSPLPTADQGWAGEISLDVDMVSAICPNCHILLVEASSANFADLGAAVNTAVTMGARFVSNSYGGSEYSGETATDTSYFHHPGVAITASSGDSGYGISYPASSPDVTAVGGTSLRVASNSRGWSETAWSGAGSGCSVDEAKPTFQTAVTTGCAGRADADVAAVADPNTGVSVYQTFGATGWNMYGGTSVASPIIASVYALAGNPGASDMPANYPYAHANNLNDVTSGGNGSCTSAVLCTAGAGWDGPTGLGTPNGTAAFTSGGGGTGPVTVTNPGKQSGVVGTEVRLQLAVSGGTGPYTYAATGLPSGLSMSAGGLISGTPTAVGTATTTVTGRDSLGATGTMSFTWAISAATVGGCTAKGQKLGNPGFETGSAAPWRTTPGVISADVNGGFARSGAYFAWLDGYGVEHTDTLSQTVTIPTGCRASLSFYLAIGTAETGTTAHDTLVLTAGSTTLARFSNVDAGNGYLQHTYDMSALAGQTVTLTFTGTENASLWTSFLIDDTALTLS